MEKEVLHLQSLVDDLFSLARSEVGHLTVQSGPIEIGTLLESLVEARAPLVLRTHKIKLLLDLPSELPAIQGDAQRLEQIFQNLLHNALRHTPPGGIIAFVGCIENEQVKVQVKDTGEGIAPQDLASIWERFYQAEQSSGRKGGAGLGLSLVKEWIEAMGGTIQVESTVGEGSCFTMYLPLASTPTPAYPNRSTN
jgi:signal transduction histidine kinase